MVSFDLPHFVVVRAFNKFKVLVALVFVILMCSEKLSFGSRVRPRIFLGF